MSRSKRKKQRQQTRYTSSAEGTEFAGLSFILAGLLSGCASYGGAASGGGGGYSTSGSSSSSSASDSLSEIQGRAINGYLVDAFVFQDRDGNGLYTSGEPATVSSSTGQFSLSGTSKTGDIIVKPLSQLKAAEIAAAQTLLNKLNITNISDHPTYYLNSSNTKQTFTGELSVTASQLATSTNITPLTTLVRGLTNSGLSVAAAESKVVSLFGASSNTDYVALASSSDASIQKAALTLKSNATGVSNLLQTALSVMPDASQDQVVNSMATAVMSKLETFSSSSSTTGSSDIGQFFLASSDMQSLIEGVASEQGVAVDPTSLQSQVSTLVTKNSTLITQETVGLLSDTGASAIDHVTSNALLRSITVPTGSSLAFALHSLTSMSDKASTPLDAEWKYDTSGAQDSSLYLPTQDGYYDLYVLIQSSLEGTIHRVRFNLDTQAPAPIQFQEAVLVAHSVDASLNISADFATAEWTNSGVLSSDTKSTVSGFVNDNAGSSVQYQLVRDNPGTVTPVDSGWLSYYSAPTGSSNYQGYDLFVRGRDLAGNVGGVVSSRFILDNVAPLSPGDNFVSLQLDTGRYADDGYTNALQWNAGATSLLDGEDGANVKQLWSVSALSATNSGVWSDTLSAPVVDGSYLLRSMQVDRAGNTSSTVERQFTLDTIAPKLAGPVIYKDLPTTPASASIAEDETGLVIGDLSVLAAGFQFIGAEWLQYTWDLYTPQDGMKSSHDWMDILSLPERDGQLTMSVRAIDLAGNVSGLLNLPTITLDQTAPLLQRASGLLEFDSINAFARAVTASTLLEPGAAYSYEVSEFSHSGSGFNLGQVLVSEKDAVGNASSAQQYLWLSDHVDRTDMHALAINDGVYATGLGVAGKFDHDIAQTAHTGDFTVLGGAESDLFANFRPGDIFLGRGGGDRVLLANGVAPLGLALLSDTERQAFQQAISSYSDLNRAFKQETPIVKLFMSSPDEEGLGGIGFAQTTTLEFTSDQTNANSTVTVLYNRAMDHWFFGLSGASNKFYFGGDESYVLGGAGADVLSGGSGRDFLVSGGSGTGTGDILNGYAGDDILVAGDYLFGSRSQAQLIGGGGNDTFIVGNGRFEASGGEGSDTYVIAPLTVSSNAPLILHISDFNPLQDRLDLGRLGLASHASGTFSDASHSHIDIDLNALLAENQQELLPGGSVLSIDLTQPIPGGTELDSILGHSEVAGSFEWSDLSTSNFILSA